LVDPDNRGPVDFAHRQAALASLDEALANGVPRDRIAADLLAAWPDGRIKLYLWATLLRHRAAAGWRGDAYAPLDVVGERADHVVAYTRDHALVVVPRLPRTLSGDRAPLGEAVWAATALALGAGAARRYLDVLTGRTVVAAERDGRAVVPLADALAVLPVAVLEPV
jgi:(1->4)-alpha-D-glucan 1-alpha-D-glucosylmutase